MLTSGNGRDKQLASSEAFVEARLKAVDGPKTTVTVYAIWAAILGGFVELNWRANGTDSVPLQRIVQALQAKLRVLAGTADEKVVASTSRKSTPNGQLAIPKERRIRNTTTWHLWPVMPVSY